MIHGGVSALSGRVVTVMEAHGKPPGQGLEHLFTGDTMIRVPCAFSPVIYNCFSHSAVYASKKPCFHPLNRGVRRAKQADWKCQTTEMVKILEAGGMKIADEKKIQHYLSHINAHHQVFP